MGACDRRENEIVKIEYESKGKVCDEVRGKKNK